MVNASHDLLHRIGAMTHRLLREPTDEDFETRVQFEANKLTAYRQAGELRRSAFALLVKSAELKKEVDRGRAQRA